jgi:dsDNA-binding SOS-regulon protein
MKIRTHVLSLLVLIGAYSNSFAQDSELLASLPKGKKAYLKSEKNVLATINWLENTPLNKEEEKHKQQSALLTGWVMNSPTVDLTLDQSVVTFTNENKELLTFFMAGYTKYALENNHSKDEVQGSIAGIRSAIKVYKNGVGLKKDAAMDKLVQLENKGELEKWVKDQLSKK